MNYFEFFDLPRKLTLDVVALEKQFYAMRRRLHPDRFASKPVAEQEVALAESSLLNDAYRTLKGPILRTQYLLKLEGVEWRSSRRRLPRRRGLRVNRRSRSFRRSCWRRSLS